MTIGNGRHYWVVFGYGPRHIFVTEPMMLDSLRMALFTSRLKSYVNNRGLTRMKNESPEYIRASVYRLNSVN